MCIENLESGLSGRVTLTRVERVGGSSLCSYEIYYIFFFQAEDGIRDLYVTGVQTCALPISPRALPRTDRPGHRRTRIRSLPHRSRARASPHATLRHRARRRARHADRHGDVRSEERRVGKECRLRWVRIELMNKVHKLRITML